MQAAFDSKFLSMSMIRQMSPLLPLTPTSPTTTPPNFLKPDLNAPPRHEHQIIFSQKLAPPKTSSTITTSSKRPIFDMTSTQDLPLDLSVKSNGLATAASLAIEKKASGRGRGRTRISGRGRNPKIATSLEVQSESVFVCPVCSQIFAVADRLSKHLASRHKNNATFDVEAVTSPLVSPPSATSRLPHVCDLCNRTFARSDMLTRHMRLHTGVKPYTCKICGQVRVP